MGEKFETKVALLVNDVAAIKDDVKEIKEKIEQQYVTKDQFEPVRNLVYGMVALILTAVVGAIITLVLKQ